MMDGWMCGSGGLVGLPPLGYLVMWGYLVNPEPMQGRPHRQYMA